MSRPPVGRSCFWPHSCWSLASSACALRTTTTEISRAEVVDRYERAVEDGADEVDEPSRRSAQTMPWVRRLQRAGDHLDDQHPAGRTATTGVPLPEPGVYPVALQGGEQLDLATGAERTYPDEGFVTVTPVECGVDIRTDFVVERWQSLEFCETENGIELGTERIFHSFFGLDDLAVRSCTASPVSVDATSWRCESETSSPFVPSPPNVSCAWWPARSVR